MKTIQIFYHFVRTILSNIILSVPLGPILFCSNYFVRTILSNIILPIGPLHHLVRTILSVPIYPCPFCSISLFFPYHFFYLPFVHTILSIPFCSYILSVPFLSATILSSHPRH